MRFFTGVASGRRFIGAVAAMAATALLGSVLVATPAVAAPTGLVVLDPDDNYSHAVWGGQSFTELPITYAISQAVKAKLTALCDTSVAITRDASQDFVDRAARAAQMQNATVSLTISLNNLNGTPWGTAADGGASSFASPYANDLAFGQRTLDEWTRFTGRHQQAPVTQGGTNGTTYPYPEFANLPGTYAQTFFGFMDHNFDWPAISGTYQGAVYGYQIDAVVTALARQLQAQNITCGDASKGQTAFPTVPSAAELAALFALGFGNWMRYGSDPVNFSTGNFLQSKTLFTVTGPGGTSTPVDLTYNSLDTRTGMFGRGWTSGLATKSQTFTDGSVLITGGDGSATAFTRNPDGSYTPVQPGIYTKLARTGEHTLTLSMPDTSAQVFTEDAYTGAGVLTSRSDRAGHTWSYTYGTTTITIPATPNPWPVAPDGTSGGTGTPARTITSFGPLASVTEPGGQTITFTADTAGRVVTATRPDGATWKISYDSAGNLAQITDPAGHTTSYGYDASNRMITVTAPDGTTYVTNTYDDAGRVVKQVNGDGSATTITYGTNSTTYTDTTGAKTTFSIDGQGRVTKVVTPLGHTLGTTYKNWDTTAATDGNGNTTKSVYDAAGRLTQTIAADRANTSYTYTAQGDLTSQTLTDGRTTSYTVDQAGHTTAIAGPDGAHWQQGFDQAGNLTSRTDPDGHTTSYGYDGHGNLTTITDAAGGKTTLAYDTASRVTGVTDPDGHTTAFTYDPVGNLISRTDGTGAKTSYTYQADDKVATITDPNGGVTTYTYNKGLNVASVTDPTGATTRYGYDSEYRRTSVTNPDGGVTKYTYNGEGLVTAVTDPDGNTTTKTYDAAQNLTSITDPTGATTTISYDTVNRPTTVTDTRGGNTVFGYDATGRLVKTTDPDGHTTTYTYDQADRVVTVTDPNGKTTQYGYDPAGNRTTTTDATGRTTTVAYDAVNRVISSADPAGAKTLYAYDPAGNLTTVTDPAGRPTSYTYDAANRVTGSTDGAGDTTRYAYDGNGNVTGITDPRGGTINFSYTGTNQLQKKTDQNGATTNYQYTAAGVLAAMVDPTGVTTAYTHDPAAQLTAVTENAVAGSPASADTNVTTTYGYDSAGRLTQVTDPLGHATNYGYNPTGQITSVTDASGNTTSYGYDPAGQETSSTKPDGKTTTYSYDPTGHLTKTAPASGSAIGYTYDDAGRLTGMSDPTGTTTWSFDTAGRISSTTTGAGKTLAYSYDPAGLRTQLTYPDGSTVKYGLDKAGRVTSQTDSTGTVSYSYDASSDLTRITRPNNTTSTYRYDPAGQITQISHTGTTAGDTDTPHTPEVNAPTTPTPAAPTPQKATTSTPAPTSTTTPTPSTSVVPSPTPTPTVTPTPKVPATPTATPTPTASATATATTSASGSAAGGSGGAAVPSSATSSVAGAVCGLLPICPAATLTAADGLPMTLTYSHDKDGRVTTLEQASASKHLTTTYSYDNLGRLTASTRTDGAKATYGYDAAGNRVTGTDTDRLTGDILGYQATYSATNQLLTQTVGPRSKTGLLGTEKGTVTTTNTWNTNGEQTSSTTTTIQTGSLLGVSQGSKTGTLTTTNSYDYAGRLTTSARSDNLTTSYTYDGLGRTVGEKLPDEYASDHLTPSVNRLLGGPGCGNGGSTPGCPADTTGDTPFVGNGTTIVNDGTTPVSWSTKETTINVMWGPEGADHQTTTSTDDGKTSTTAAWLYLDAQGTVRATADSSGTTQTASAYTDFGAAEPTAGSLKGTGGGNPQPHHPTHAAAGPILANTTTTTPVGYTGQQNNPDAGLIQYPARTYQPGQAQWIQADTNPGHLDRPQTLNKYAFVLNDPATLIDPDGHDPAYANCSTLQCRNTMYSGPPNPSASTVNSSGADPRTYNGSPTKPVAQQSPHAHSQQSGYSPEHPYVYADKIFVGTTSLSSAEAFARIRGMFGSIFPPAAGTNDPAQLSRVGQIFHLEFAEINIDHLSAGDVQVTAISHNSFTFTALKTHPDYPGVITFSFNKQGQNLYLNVKGIIEHDPPGTAVLYPVLTAYLWSTFAYNVGQNVPGIEGVGPYA